MKDMDNANMIDRSEAVCRSLLGEVMTNVSADDIELLEDLKKVYKRIIPFSKRMYVAAYLLKRMLDNGITSNKSYISTGRGGKQSAQKMPRQGNVSRADTDGGSRVPLRSTGSSKPMTAAYTTSANATPQGDSGAGDEEKHPHLKVEIPIDQMATIFVSIGRGRRVYPRDLVGLFVNVAGVERQRIGGIRVMSGYSFVQVYKDDGDGIIAKLNGYDYRGKSLVVSYSREKENSTDNAQESTSPSAHDADDMATDEAASLPAADTSAAL